MGLELDGSVSGWITLTKSQAGEHFGGEGGGIFFNGNGKRTHGSVELDHKTTKLSSRIGGGTVLKFCQSSL